MTTAHVEMLTAQVRTLMVGSRQITLSIAKQLDWVEFKDVIPFGRVRIRKTHLIDVIGIHRKTGDLVLASIECKFMYDKEYYENEYPLIVLAGLK